MPSTGRNIRADVSAFGFSRIVHQVGGNKIVPFALERKEQLKYVEKTNLWL
jgi:hypothetical protein